MTDMNDARTVDNTKHAVSWIVKYVKYNWKYSTYERDYVAN